MLPLVINKFQKELGTRSANPTPLGRIAADTLALLKQCALKAACFAVNGSRWAKMKPENGDSGGGDYMEMAVMETCLLIRIGRALWSETGPLPRDENLFDIVNQINWGAALIDPPEERDRVAELNLCRPACQGLDGLRDRSGIFRRGSRMLKAT